MMIQSKRHLIFPEADLKESQATLQALHANAHKLLKEMVLSKGGKMPSDQALQMAAKLMAAKAMRRLHPER
nr:hypothetical protein [uncultured Rhodoferax sp.]